MWVSGKIEVQNGGCSWLQSPEGVEKIQKITVRSSEEEIEKRVATCETAGGYGRQMMHVLHPRIIFSKSLMPDRMYY
jgi:hypothetical protein